MYIQSILLIFYFIMYLYYFSEPTQIYRFLRTRNQISVSKNQLIYILYYMLIYNYL